MAIRDVGAAARGVRYDARGSVGCAAVGVSCAERGGVRRIARGVRAGADTGAPSRRVILPV